MSKTNFLIIIFFNFIYNSALYFLSDIQKKKTLPANVRDIYDSEEYKKWREYKAEISRLNVVENIFTFIVTVLLFSFDGFAIAYRYIYGIFYGEYSLLALGGAFLPSIIVLALYTLFMSLLSLPFEYVGSMIIEEKYGFNKSTKKTFFLDFIKGIIINLILNIGLMCLTLGLYRGIGKLFYIPVYAILAVFTIAISVLSLPMQKIFNKFTPLEEGELRSSLAALFEKNGYSLGQIYIMDASRRTTKVNAFCSGLGKFKNIVLYDNLVNGYTPDEITAVFAHELGHYKHRDTAKMTLYSLVMMLGLTLSISSLVLIESVSLDYGFDSVNVMFAFISAMSVVMSPVMTLLMIPSSILGRKYEYCADRFAAENGYAGALVSSLKKLTKDNMGDLNPHPVIVALEHNHPTLSQRITALEKYVHHGDNNDI